MYYTPLKEKYIYYVKALDVLEPSSEPLKTEFDRETVFVEGNHCPFSLLHRRLPTIVK